MTWLTWRQHRAEGMILLAVLAVLAVFLLITGLNMVQVFQQLGLSDCLANGHRDCGALVDTFGMRFDSLFKNAVWLNVLPALVGMLVGAPLVARELEQRTHLLVWTQSITRWRWLAVKLALVLGAGLLVSGILLGLFIWWYGPLNQVHSRFYAPAYDFQGPVLVASTLLALALGIAAGALTRRTVLAMFLTLVCFVAIRVPVEVVLRPHFLPPISNTNDFSGQLGPDISTAQDWIFQGGGWVDAQGHPVADSVVFTTCNPSSQPFNDPAVQQCLQTHGYRSSITYQPGDRFWTFQWIETGIYLAFAALALGATAWLVRRRLA